MAGLHNIQRRGANADAHIVSSRSRTFIQSLPSHDKVTDILRFGWAHLNRLMFQAGSALVMTIDIVNQVNVTQSGAGSTSPTYQQSGPESQIGLLANRLRNNMKPLATLVINCERPRESFEHFWIRTTALLFSTRRLR